MRAHSRSGRDDPRPAGRRRSTTPWTDPPRTGRDDACRRGRVAAGRSAESPALRYNALDMLVRAGGVPIRVASKSVRVREVIDATLALPGLRGHPRVHASRGAVARRDARGRRRWATRPSTAPRSPRSPRDERAAARVTLMVDDLAQLDRRRRRRRAGAARDDPRRDRRGRVVARSRARPHRRAPLAGARARRGREPRARDRRPPGLPPGRAHDVRGADRRSGRCHRLRRRRHPLDAAPLRRTSCSTGAPRSSARCATSPRSSSSTAAAPARSS